MTWAMKASTLATRAGKNGYGAANARIISQTVLGLGMFGGKDPGSGVRVVYNISSAHIRAFLNEGYKNCYDLKAKPVSARRGWVDDAIAQVAGPGVSKQDLYYGAVELNGAGMRYYGDLCLVLQPHLIIPDSLVLYRNSYDLDREPIVTKVANNPTKLVSEARTLSGLWSEVADMVVCKILDGATIAPRLVTSGFVSDGILSDEDYLEVPRTKSFRGADLAEVRTAAADVAAESRIADRIVRGPTPTLAEFLWRHRRRDAESALLEHDVNFRVITSPGRQRG